MSFLEIQTRTAWGRTLEGFAAWCNPQPGWLCLDVGCGPGLLPALLARHGCRAFGADLDFTSLVGRLHPLLVQASAACLPFPGAAFDLLTASNLLFLLPNPPAALDEMARLLRPGGRLCLLNPSENMSVAAAHALAAARDLQGLDRQSLLDWAARAEAHQRWGEAGLVALIRRSGLQLERTELRIGPGLARLASATKPTAES